VAIVITTQSYINPDRYESQRVVPIGGNALTNISKHRIRLKHLSSNQFIGELDMSYRYPHNQTYFTINEGGVTDIQYVENSGKSTMSSCYDTD
jgi:hypothetical protein